MTKPKSVWVLPLFPWWKSRHDNSWRQRFGIWLLERLPHSEIDCGFEATVTHDGVEDLGTQFCLTPSARGYACRTRCVRQTHIYSRRLMEIGKL